MERTETGVRSKEELGVNIAFDRWVTIALNGVCEALTAAVKNGMPPSVAREVAEDVAKLLFDRGMKVEGLELLEPVIFVG